MGVKIINKFRSAKIHIFLFALLGLSIFLILNAVFTAVEATNDNKLHFKVVDANGEEVGFPLMPNLLMKRFGDDWVAIPFKPNPGFADQIDSAGISAFASSEAPIGAILFTSSDCTGTGYWSVEFEPQLTVVSNNVLQYGGGSTQQITVLSYSSDFSPPIEPENCQSNIESMAYVQEHTTFDLSALNLVLPFKVVRE
ncbi:MAG: hypothetical protein A2945_03385 [Candidatus Liptonbacteria bacterium RIFCSPLOWO2_01_FULL_52_25]|uniref:Uncharacterized protein n=1 Tax=Candidatus Liptonbacteria bacterium RIFCSPLOWO2_01_FULL_52_25 TaxID=1798650 RepID=A0A1G2CG52_9BACT|nr:MAG: hypothetical protein A2945_03385 [Candidatus Liptonbacteria bacterium RIFCSPLOWO2_01_FULL_52_25]